MGHLLLWTSLSTLYGHIWASTSKTMFQYFTYSVSNLASAIGFNSSGHSSGGGGSWHSLQYYMANYYHIYITSTIWIIIYIYTVIIVMMLIGNVKRFPHLNGHVKLLQHPKWYYSSIIRHHMFFLAMKL